ncbi:RNA polymerase sigma-70 factor [Sphingobacterium sp. Mn56C]|uniref:RNA polymerase sigma-70 factor n=1 Tax=Sphingobacterium sp. Mn56C TaxID=3395261 RepID=UPI003BE82AD4
MSHTELDWQTEKGFTTLYTLYAKKMYRVAYSYLHDRDNAQELVQKIFVNLWERRYVVQIQSSVEHYLLRAIKYAIFRFIEEQAKRTPCMQASIDTNDTLPGPTSPIDQLVFKETLQQIEDRIKTLPSKRRTIFQLSREDGLKNQEIASRLKVSTKTVEYHIKHSLLFLKKKF